MILPLLESDISNSETTLGKLINGVFNLINLPTTGTTILSLLVLFFFARAALLIGQTWYQADMLSNHLSLVRTRLINSIFKTNYTHLSRYDAGYLTNGIVRELESVNHGLRMLMDLVVQVVMASIYILLPILIQPILTLSLFALAIPISVMAFILVRKTSGLSIRLTELYGRQQSLLIEGIRNANATPPSDIQIIKLR